MNSHIHRSSKEGNSESSAFTLQELAVVLAVVGFLTTMLLPAMARTRTNSTAAQCRNNLQQIAAAWAMYSPDNAGYLVSAYPSYGSFKATWCAGTAQTGGGVGSYVYGGADPTGIQLGLLWPYVKSLGLYHCPSDYRVATTGPAQYIGKPILRSISMNSYMAGRSMGASPDWVITSPGGKMDPRYPVYTKEAEITKPSKTWLVLDEDQVSINDAMFIVNVGGVSFPDLPSRAHGNGYGINFVDGHAELWQLHGASIAWTLTNPTADARDYYTLRDATTNPPN